MWRMGQGTRQIGPRPSGGPPMLSRNASYHELGTTYFDAHQRAHLVDRLTQRLEHLGYRVSLEPLPPG
jgi:hypothetical protein